MKRLLRAILYRIRGEVTTERLVRLGLVVGRNFRRNEHCIIDPSHCWLIEIGDDVTLAPNVHILAHDASTYSSLGRTRIARVSIGSNVFLGAGTIVLPGVRIGDDVIVGAGSVVTKSVEAGSVMAGNPARKIGEYDAYIERQATLMKGGPTFDARFTLRNPHFDRAMKERMKRELESFRTGFVE